MPGYGDTTARLKYNLWGNDNGRSALAVIPYLKLPTSEENIGNHSIEGGLIVPLDVELPADIDLGLTTSFDALRDENGPGYAHGIRQQHRSGALIVRETGRLCGILQRREHRTRRSLGGDLWYGPDLRAYDEHATGRGNEHRGHSFGGRLCHPFLGLT